MNQVYVILSAVSVALLGPVVVVLLAATAWTIWRLGHATSEAWLRRRTTATYAAVLESLRTAANLRLARRVDAVGPRLLALWAAEASEPAHAEEALERSLDRVELQARARVERLRLVARIGPALGLMGTLIPLGPALVALAEGNLERLARNLVVAFGTTVLGLLVAVLAQVLAVAYGRWYATDLADIEHLVARWSQRMQPEDDSATLRTLQESETR